MAKTWTLAELRLMPVNDRAALYRNACRLGDRPGAAALKALIEEAGLPFSESACLTNDDPLTLKMHEIIHSVAGREAAILAAKAGLPALAGVDPLIARALGADYGPHNFATNTAGSLVGELMSSLGYRKAAPMALPPGCVARSGLAWL